MNRNLFHNWLRSFKKLDTTTSNARTSNCARIEKYYDDLDQLYNTDRCTNLIEQFGYSTTDKKLNREPLHKIPIDGDLYTGTHTLDPAVKLYIEFRDNAIIEELEYIGEHFINIPEG
jgi:hypothetical protein